MLRRCAALMTIMVLLTGLTWLLAGCGDYSGISRPKARLGAIKLYVTWPPREESTEDRLIPAASNAIAFEIYRDTSTPEQRVVIARPETQATLVDVPVGTVTLRATAHPNSDGTGTSQAMADTNVTVLANQFVQVSLTLQSTIDHLEVTSASSLTITPGQSITLVATPKNADGATVLVAPGNITWRSSNSSVATVNGSGVVTGVANGSAVMTATETESGKQGTAAVTVSENIEREMVWVPLGQFARGNPGGVGYDNEHPLTTPYLDGFWIDKYEVTVAQYREFCTATGRPLPSFPSGYSWAGKSGWADPALQNHPIVNVSWYDAKDYADWAGLALPTEAQWEKAARGVNWYNYPWGGVANTVEWYKGWDSSKCVNYYTSASMGNSTHPVGSFPSGVSPYGAQDMAGNAGEWCADWYQADYYSVAPLSNPPGPSTGTYRILRGGSWFSSEDSTRTACRFAAAPNEKDATFGFRCVSSSSTSSPSVSLTATPSTISSGESVTLTWSSSNATTVVSSNFGATTVNGSKTVSPTVTTTYTITVSGAGGEASDSVTVTVTSQGREMVWVPGGTFTMGTDIGISNESPVHQVTLTGFWIDKYEVTVAQYRAFCAATGRALPLFPSGYSWAGKSGWTDPALQNHPIVYVSWYDAKAYADWAGLSLPTEAQWEYAARGTAGNNYPWGGTATSLDKYNGWDQTKCANEYNSILEDKSTWPVGSFPTGVSWCGVHDLAGNVWEWCADYYDVPYSSTPATNPTGPASGSYRVQRGGSWHSSNFYVEDDYRSANRGFDWPYGEWVNGEDVGFRCVSNSPRL